MNKLICVIMGQNCENFIGMCLSGVHQADKIIYCDGGSTDQTLDIVSGWFLNSMQGRIIKNTYDQEDKQANGKQRNFYLNYLKQNYPDDWALCLDADEVVDDLSKIKEFIQIAQPALYSVRMRHFQQDLGHEDSTKENHFVPHRLFKISEADSYPETEHPVLQP